MGGVYSGQAGSGPGVPGGGAGGSGGGGRYPDGRGGNNPLLDQNSLEWFSRGGLGVLPPGMGSVRPQQPQPQSTLPPSVQSQPNQQQQQPSIEEIFSQLTRPGANPNAIFPPAGMPT